MDLLAWLASSLLIELVAESHSVRPTLLQNSKCTKLTCFPVVGTAATVVLFAILAALTHLTEIHPDTKKYAIGAIVVVALFLLAVSASW